MSSKEWFSQGSPKVVGPVLATAVVAGLGLGAGLQLPDYLAHPIYQGSPQMILADDPGLQKWNQVVASLGGIGATFVVPAAFYQAHSPEPEFALDLADQMAAEMAQIDAEQRAQAMRVSWVETPPRRYGYEPVTYTESPADAPPVYGQGYEQDGAHEPDAAPEPEQTPAAADEPVPPPPPRPSQDWLP